MNDPKEQSGALVVLICTLSVIGLALAISLALGLGWTEIVRPAKVEKPNVTYPQPGAGPVFRKWGE
jgi:hypothetical protein